jgi:hypothetical protein
LGQVTGDPAVVADESLLFGFRVLDVRMMDEAPHRLAAGWAEAIPKGLSVLAGEEPLLEADVDV